MINLDLDRDIHNPLVSFIVSYKSHSVPTSKYQDFIEHRKALTTRLLSQVYQTIKLVIILVKKFYGGTKILAFPTTWQFPESFPMYLPMDRP